MSAIAFDASVLHAPRRTAPNLPKRAAAPAPAAAATVYFEDAAAPRAPVSLNQSLAHECDGWMRWTTGRI